MSHLALLRVSVPSYLYIMIQFINLKTILGNNLLIKEGPSYPFSLERIKQSENLRIGTTLTHR